MAITRTNSTSNTTRTAWADAYRLHAAAVEKLGQLEQGAFWEWYHAQAQQIANAHDNGELILALLLAVFDDVEGRDKQRARISTDKSA